MWRTIIQRMETRCLVPGYDGGNARKKRDIILRFLSHKWQILKNYIADGSQNFGRHQYTELKNNKMHFKISIVVFRLTLRLLASLYVLVTLPNRSSVCLNLKINIIRRTFHQENKVLCLVLTSADWLPEFKQWWQCVWQILDTDEQRRGYILDFD